MSGTIENAKTREAMIAEFSQMHPAQLQAQQFVQQGAVHAVSWLIANGCTEAKAQEMLESLRDNNSVLKAIMHKRGIASIDEALS